MTTLTNWLGALAIALVLSTSYLLDGPSDNEAAQDMAADLQDAQNEARTQAHLDNRLGKAYDTAAP